MGWSPCGSAHGAGTGTSIDHRPERWAGVGADRHRRAAGFLGHARCPCKFATTPSAWDAPRQAPRVQCRISGPFGSVVAARWPRNSIAVAHRSAAKLLRSIPRVVASSRSCAPCRSSTVRKPLWTSKRAAAAVSPRRSHALDASQYSSKDEALRLMEKQRSFQAEAVLPANYLTAERPIRDIA